jgi:hypothetical protein
MNFKTPAKTILGHTKLQPRCQEKCGISEYQLELKPDISAELNFLEQTHKLDVVKLFTSLRS